MTIILQKSQGNEKETLGNYHLLAKIWWLNTTKYHGREKKESMQNVLKFEQNL